LNIGTSGKIISPLAEVDHISTNIISPLGKDKNIALKINSDSISIAKDASSAAVATIDNNGNASFSGSLKSNELAVNSDASISGTLYAHKIKADEIEGLSEKVGTLAAQNITNVTNIFFATPSATPTTIASNQEATSSSNQQHDSLALHENYENIASFSAYLSYVPHLQATTAQFDQGLMSFGPTSLADTTIAGQLAIGGQMILNNNTINVLGGDLELQPLRQGGVKIAGGQVAIDSDGNLTVNGKSIFNGTLAAKVISPISNTDDLTIQLGQNKESGNATSSLKINNASNSGVFAVNQFGDILASGAATISKLNINIAAPAQAVSENEVIATSSAGTTTILPHQREITIDTPVVTEHSLIYITPVGATNDQTPFLLRQLPHESFTVGITEPINSPTKFNWLIIN
jgi:hypothetical protein